VSSDLTRRHGISLGPGVRWASPESTAGQRIETQRMIWAVPRSATGSDKARYVNQAWLSCTGSTLMLKNGHG